MPNAGQILKDKGAKTGLHTIAPDASVQEACRQMKRHGTDCLVVVDGKTVEGLLTDVDVVNKVVAEGKDAAKVSVSDACTRTVYVVKPDRPLEEIEALMEQHHIRHVPVAGDDELLGVIDVFDVVHHHADRHRQHAQMLSDYIYGRH